MPIEGKGLINKEIEENPYGWESMLIAIFKFLPYIVLYFIHMIKLILFNLFND